MRENESQNIIESRDKAQSHVITPTIEILVHAAAPSRGIDDARYRALAAAYLQFEASPEEAGLRGIREDIRTRKVWKARSPSRRRAQHLDIAQVHNAEAIPPTGSAASLYVDYHTYVHVEGLAPLGNEKHVDLTEGTVNESTATSAHNISGEPSYDEDASYRESLSQAIPTPPRRHTRSSLRSAVHHVTKASGSQSQPEELPMSASIQRRFLEHTATSPQLSFASVVDNLDSPSFRSALRRIPGLKTTQSPGIDHHVSDRKSDVGSQGRALWETPPSELLDSQSTADRIFEEFNSPSTALRTFLQRTSQQRVLGPKERLVVEALDEARRDVDVDKVEPVTVSIAEDLAQTADIAAPRKDQDYYIGVPSVQLPPAELPAATVSVVNVPSEVPASAAIPSEKAGSSTCVTPSDETSRVVDTPTNQAPSYRPNTSRSRKRASSPSYGLDAERRGTRFQSSVQPETSLDGTVTPQKTPDIVRAPVPGTNSIPSHVKLATTLVTTPLYNLAKELNLKARYKPALQTRALIDDERGYWDVDARAWGAEVRAKGWNFLARFVSAGQAGWSTWCIRGQDDEIYDDSNADADADARWRVFCWGKTAPHIWLLLYMVSERKLKSCAGEARWIDGEGVPVVSMTI